MFSFLLYNWQNKIDCVSEQKNNISIIFESMSHKYFINFVFKINLVLVEVRIMMIVILMIVTSRMDIPSFSRYIHGFSERISRRMHRIIYKILSINLTYTECLDDNLTHRIYNILIIIEIIEINACERYCASLRID